jgi:hypothetical protein
MLLVLLLRVLLLRVCVLDKPAAARTPAAVRWCVWLKAAAFLLLVLSSTEMRRK